MMPGKNVFSNNLKLKDFFLLIENVKGIECIGIDT